MYVELHARSAFSFLEGASAPESLIARCAELKMPAMALLDRDGIYGAPRFHMAAQKAKIQAHIGAEVSCNFSPQDYRETAKAKAKAKSKNNLQKDAGPPCRGRKFRLPLLVCSRTGY